MSRYVLIFFVLITLVISTFSVTTVENMECFSCISLKTKEKFESKQEKKLSLIAKVINCKEICSKNSTSIVDSIDESSTDCTDKCIKTNCAKRKNGVTPVSNGTVAEELCFMSCDYMCNYGACEGCQRACGDIMVEEIGNNIDAVCKTVCNNLKYCDGLQREGISRSTINPSSGSTIPESTNLLLFVLFFSYVLI